MQVQSGNYVRGVLCGHNPDWIAENRTIRIGVTRLNQERGAERNGGSNGVVAARRVCRSGANARNRRTLRENGSRLLGRNRVAENLSGKRQLLTDIFTQGDRKSTRLNSSH